MKNPLDTDLVNKIELPDVPTIALGDTVDTLTDLAADGFDVVTTRTARVGTSIGRAVRTHPRRTFLALALIVAGIFAAMAIRRRHSDVDTDATLRLAA